MDTIFGVVGKEQALHLAGKYDTPLYVYSEAALEDRAREMLGFPNAYGLTVRYAMKALPTKKILQVFNAQGLHIDASSGNEVQRALWAGFSPSKIQLTAQELPENRELSRLLLEGVRVTASSLHQLERLADLSPDGRDITLRVNPGIGSGHCRKTNVGGPSSSFGIWHEYIREAKEFARDNGLRVRTLHTHIGSGSNPKIWKDAALRSLQWVKEFDDVSTLNLGGGFKVARMPDEKATNIQRCGGAIKTEFEKFYAQTGRKLHLEVEPGTYLVANAGVVLSRIIDVKSTSDYTFLVVNSGMNEVTRPALYGAQHPIHIIPKNDDARDDEIEYIVAGHCCESGDVWTVKKGKPDVLQERILSEAQIGDVVVLGGGGAYCSGMSTAGYNSYTAAAEVLIRKDGIDELIRRRQTLRQLVDNEK